jgi:nitrogenase molybdenum-iron protein NifN
MCAEIVLPKKACATNPLKCSTPLGAALAFLGMDNAIPLFHGSQGCTSFALVAAVRHFKEAIPLQTTAMDEISTILGGAGNLEQALVNLQGRMKPSLIGIASTALTETRGEDLAVELRTILARRPDLRGTAVVHASTPDYAGALEDGWAKAVTAIVDALAEPATAVRPDPRRVNILPSVHQTAGDIEELCDLVKAFGLRPVVLPDLSRALDGPVPDSYRPTSFGGASLEDARTLGAALHTIAVTEQMRGPAELLRARAGVPATVFATLTGLEPGDRLVALLQKLSGREAPAKIRRQRSQLLDAMLDGHFHFGGRRVAIGADPDHLFGLAQFFASMGAEIVAAVASTPNSPRLADVPAERVPVGDLMDLEDAAREAEAELLVTHAHGRQASERLGVPLLRAGFPIFDRLGHAHRRSVSYRGTRDLIFEVANIALAGLHAHTPADFAHLLHEEARDAPAARH